MTPRGRKRTLTPVQKRGVVIPVFGAVVRRDRGATLRLGGGGGGTISDSILGGCINHPPKFR